MDGRDETKSSEGRPRRKQMGPERIGSADKISRAFARVPERWRAVFARIIRAKSWRFVSGRDGFGEDRAGRGVRDGVLDGEETKGWIWR